MIESKKFENVTELNRFIQENNVEIVSIETKKEKYNTGLPLPRGGSFITERDVLKLWYNLH